MFYAHRNSVNHDSVSQTEEVPKLKALTKMISVSSGVGTDPEIFKSPKGNFSIKRYKNDLKNGGGTLPPFHRQYIHTKPPNFSPHGSQYLQIGHGIGTDIRIFSLPSAGGRYVLKFWQEAKFSSGHSQVVNSNRKNCEFFGKTLVIFGG